MKRSLKVYYPNSTTGILEMRFSGTMPEVASNVDVLLEKVTKLLLTALGSNRFNPELGSGIGNKTSLSFNLNQAQVELIIHQAVSDVEKLVLGEQSLDGTTNLLPEQTLEKLELSQVLQYSEDPTTYYAEVIVHTKGNQLYFLTI